MKVYGPPLLIPNKIETYQKLHNFMVLNKEYDVGKEKIYRWINLFFSDREEFKEVLRKEPRGIQECIWLLLRRFFCGHWLDIPKELWQDYLSDFDLVGRADIAQKKDIIKEKVIVPCEYFINGNWIIVDMEENEGEAVNRFWEDWESLGDNDYITAVTCYI